MTKKDLKKTKNHSPFEYEAIGKMYSKDDYELIKLNNGAVKLVKKQKVK